LKLRPRVPLLICAAAVGLAACGSSSSTSSTATTPAATTPAATTPAATTPAATAPATTTAPKSTSTAAAPVAVAADPSGQLAYVQKSLTAKAGKVTFNFTNAAPVPHDLAIGQGSKQLGATPVFSGGSKSLTVSLAKGTYQFYCTVPGHRQSGMEGTLTVS
jgi:plastocyanin